MLSTIVRNKKKILIETTANQTKAAFEAALYDLMNSVALSPSLLFHDGEFPFDIDVAWKQRWEMEPSNYPEDNAHEEDEVGEIRVEKTTTQLRDNPPVYRTATSLHLLSNNHIKSFSKMAFFIVENKSFTIQKETADKISFRWLGNQWIVHFIVNHP